MPTSRSVPQPSHLAAAAAAHLDPKTLLFSRCTCFNPNSMNRIGVISVKHIVTEVMEEAVAPWATLPAALLELILERLPIPDYLRFASVCLSWHHVQQNHRRYHATFPPYERQLPWLMLPGDGQSTPQQKVFYSPSEQRCYRLLEGLGIDLWKHPYDYSEVESPQGIPYVYSRLESSQGVLSPVSTNPDHIVLMWNHRERTSLSFRRLRDDSWTSLPIQGRFIANPVFCGGKFYLLLSRPFGEVSEGRKLAVVDACSSPSVSYFDMEMDLLPPVSIVNMKFLVECDGHVLLVRIAVHGSSVIGFDVFKADLSRKVWVRLESLGERVLFLAQWHSFSMSAADTGGPGNRIYFSWLMKDKLFIGYNYGSQDLIGTILSDLPCSMERSLFGQYSVGLWQWVVPLL